MNVLFDPQKLLPTDDDVRFYEEHGFLICPAIYSEDEIEEAAYGIERYYHGERDYALVEKLKQFEGWRPGAGSGQRINDYVSLQNKEIAALLSKPILGDIAARLCKSPSVRLWHDQLILKPAGIPESDTGIGWHTDRAYWRTCKSDNMITAWIPLHDCDEEMGTLLFVDRSHTWRNTGLKGFHGKDILSGELVPQMAERIPAKIKRGQVTFHHCFTIHGSGPNRASRPRISLSVHIQDEANTYRECRESRGEVIWHRNDVLCRKKNGVPDYSDPDICPMLGTSKVKVN
jgi:hypothetical protein